MVRCRNFFTLSHQSFVGRVKLQTTCATDVILNQIHPNCIVCTHETCKDFGEALQLKIRKVTKPQANLRKYENMLAFVRFSCLLFYMVDGT